MQQSADVIPFKAEAHRIRMLLTREFRAQAILGLTYEQRTGLYNYVSANPDKGRPIRGVPGLRSIEWCASNFIDGRARVVYYFRDLNMPLLYLSLVEKTTRIRFSATELRQMEEEIAICVARLSVESNLKLTA